MALRTSAGRQTSQDVCQGVSFASTHPMGDQRLLSGALVVASPQRGCSGTDSAVALFCGCGMVSWWTIACAIFFAWLTLHFEARAFR